MKIGGKTKKIESGKKLHQNYYIPPKYAYFMLDKILSVKLAGGLMTAFMALHILIMFGSAEDGETYYFEMIMFLTLTLLAGSTFFMDEASARKALLAFGAGLMPAVLLFTYPWISGGDTADGPPAFGMVMWWLFVVQSLLVGLNVGTTSD